MTYIIKEIISFRGKYYFLSNFYFSNIKFFEYGEYKIYPTAEHFYQAYKTTNLDSRKQIREISTPGKAKRFGQKVILREDWEQIKDTVMLTVIKLKFSQNSELKKKLLDTGEALLIEGNYWHDNYWGNCYCFKCRNTKGLNQLGKTLMKIRLIP